MPRIPTSKPDRAPRRPSVGGQVDIRSQDAFFRSIASASAEAGAAIEKAQEEKQKLIDSKEANEVAVFQSERRAELAKRLREESDVSRHQEIIDEWSNNTSRLNLRPGVSKEAKEALQQKHNLFMQNARASFIEDSSRLALQQSRDAAHIAAQTAVESGSWQDVVAAFDNNEAFSEQERSNEINKYFFKVKQKEQADDKVSVAMEKERIDVLIASAESSEDIDLIKDEVEGNPIFRSDYGQKTSSIIQASLASSRKIHVNREESLIKSDLVNQMEAVQSLEDLDELYDNLPASEYSEKLNSDLKIARDNREKRIITQNAQRLNNEITLLSKRVEQIGSGEIETIDEALAGILDPEIRSFLKKSFYMSDGTRGVSDPEFLELAELVDGSRSLLDVVSGGTIKRIEDFVLDPDTSMQARFAATDLLVSRTAVDEANTLEAALGYKEEIGPDGEPVYQITDWSNEVVYLDDFQRSMVKSVSMSLSQHINKASETKNWTSSLLKPRAVIEIYRTINSGVFLSEFKKSDELKTKSDLSKKIQEVFYDPDDGIISKHYKDSIPHQLNRLIYSKKQQAKEPL